ncbi:MAG: Cna B-type domain-containing protein, partial [Clostridia bacterium]|nr:Cna B-type domain-containing protein [Clostridia bacterium]
MKKNHYLLHRVVAMLMCVCMLVSNTGIALSDTPAVVSDPVPLLDQQITYSPENEVPLGNYAQLTHKLTADRDGTPLPDTVEDGQSLFFQLAFDLTKQDDLYLLRQAYQNGEVGPDTVFTVDVSFLNLLGSANYPTSYDGKDNIASDGDKKIFRWWVDEASGKICLRFYENVYTDEGAVSNTKVAFEGTLDTSGRDDDGQLHFGVDGVTTSLIAKQSYGLTKTAGVPYFSTDASSYLVDYTVTLTLDQNMKLSADAAGNMYCAALTLEDTVLADGALAGEIFGNPVVTAPEGETATVALAANGTVNTLTVTSPDQVLGKGEYTFVYKMKVDSAAALAKLADYTDAQKTNTVEVKENGQSLKTPLTATATIAWDEVTDEQFKIDKNAFTDHGADYSGVYMDETSKKYYIDYRVVVYIHEPVQTFTVIDAPQYAVGIRDDVPITLEGADTAAGYWTREADDATLSDVEATLTTEVQQLPLGNDGAMANCQVITVTAPDDQLLAPGAYYLRIPADVTGAVSNALKNDYPQYYSNTAYLTSVDGVQTNEYKEFKQPIPKYTEPSKSGGYEVNPDTGELLFYEGKPVIRWDVWFGWDFYNKSEFVDSMTGMELLVNANYPMEIHSFKDSKNFTETLASLKSLTDTNYIDFTEDGTGFTFKTENLDTNTDGTSVKLYKLVYFSTPLDDEEDTGYLTTGLKNSYTVTHKDPFGNGFGEGPGTGEAEPTMTGNARLYVSKKHVIELNDSLTQWKITCDNTQNKVPFALLGDLEIIDLVPKAQTPIGEVNIHYSDQHPITVEMTCDNNAKIPLVEGTHYTIEKQHTEFDFGQDGKYGFAVKLNMEALAEIMEEQGAVYFKTIDVLCYLENETHPSGQNYRIKNDGWLSYTNQGQSLLEGVNAHYDRGFSTKRKGVHPYEDNYNPNSPRRYYVANIGENGKAIGWKEFTGGYNHDPAIGDGLKEIVWRIYIGAREFGNDDNPITVTVTDTFSDNQMFPTYEGKELKDLFLIRAEDAMDYIILPDSVVVDGNTFTLTFTVPGGGWAAGTKDKSKDIIIDYHTILKPEAIKDALDQAPDGSTSVIVPYNNTATVGWNGGSYTIPTETSSATFSTSMLDKTSSIVTAVSEIEYTILINELRLPLNNGQPLVLTDTLGAGKENFLYRDDSIELVNADTGAALTAGSAVTDSTYTITWATGDTKGFTISVPDGQKLKLSYRVKPQNAIGEDTAQLSNSASLDGRTSSHVQDSFKVSASNQEATYTPPTGTAAVSIRKLEGSSSVQILLPGAEFTAYPVLPDGSLGDAFKTITTDTAGKALFSFVRNGDEGYETVYCIKETKAPVGYEASDAEWYFFFSTDGKAYANDAVKGIVELLRSQNKTVQQVFNETVHQMNVENMPYTCDLRIYKTTPEGDGLQGAVFALNDARGNAMGAPVVENVDGKTCYIFRGLKGGNYTLTEVQAPVGYVRGDVSSWSLTLDPVNSSVAINWLDGTADEVKALVTTGSEDGAATLTIINNEAEPAQVQIPVTKQLENANTAEAAFVFTMTAESENAPMPAGTDENGCVTVSTADAAYDADGKAELAFAPISFGIDHLDQEYTYRITEEPVAVSTNFTGDTTVYFVKVAVEWNAADEKVEAEVVTITDGDGNEQEGITFVNTFDPSKTTVTVNKAWDDANDQDGKRAGVVANAILSKTVGDTTTDIEGATVTVGAADDWSFTWSDLPVYENGVEIVYSVREELVTANGYTSDTPASVAVDNGGTITITNSYNPKLTTISVAKIWDDANDQDGKRAGVVANAILSKTVGDTTTDIEGATVTVGAADDWNFTWSDLPVYENGVEIVYSVREELVTANGYTSNTTVAKEVANGGTITITNSYKPKLTTISVAKIWDDANDQDGKRTGVVANAILSKTVGDTSADIEDATVTVGADNDWSYTWNDLPVYEDGVKIVYSVREELVTANGYTSDTPASVAVDNGGTITITNSYNPKLTTISVAKIWDDANDQDGKRTGVVAKAVLSKTVGDTTTDIEGATVTVGAADDWSYTWSDLPVYENGVEIVYSVREELVTANGYTSNTTVAKEVANGSTITITNSYNPKLTTISVEKVWDDADDQDGKRTGVVAKAILSKTVGDTTTDIEGETVTVGADNDWSYTWNDLPVYENGVKIVYSVREELVTANGYTSDTPASVAVDNGSTITITNSYNPKLTTISVEKLWDDANDQDGKRTGVVANAILSKTVGDTTTDIEGETVTVGADNDWSFTWSDLPVYENGVKIVYSVREELVTANGYTSDTPASVAVDNGGTITITNRYNPELTTISVEKIWNDADDQDGKRPESITINLLADGVEIRNAEIQPDETGAWTWSFTDLPKYRDQGVEIVYTITEEAVPGYTTEIDGFNVTNSYIPETIAITGSKTWNDADDQDGKRPESITISLLADGTEIKTAEIKPDETSAWAWSFTDLPKYRDQGVEIVYTITEAPVIGYTTEIDGFNVTNSYIPETTAITGSKTWNDADDQDGKRPESITIHLLADGTEIKTAE